MGRSDPRRRRAAASTGEATSTKSSHNTAMGELDMLAVLTEKKLPSPSIVDLKAAQPYIYRQSFKNTNLRQRLSELIMRYEVAVEQISLR